MRSRSVLFVALAAFLVAPASAAPTFVIRGDSDIGGFTLTHNGSLKTAIDIYGTPTTRQPFGDVCTVVWDTYGIKAQFFYMQPGACSPNACHRESALRGKQWRTAKGLHIGDTLQRLHKLYRHSRRFIGSDWALASRPFAGVRTPTLLATVNARRVVAFVVRSPWLFMC
jgi:hypothetical protein